MELILPHDRHQQQQQNHDVETGRTHRRSLYAATTMPPCSNKWNGEETLSIFFGLHDNSTSSFTNESEKETEIETKHGRRVKYTSPLSPVRQPARPIKDRPILLSLFIVVLGLGITAAFMALGVRGVQNDQRLRLEKQASDIANAVESTWHYYKMAAMWIHDRCRSTADHQTRDGAFSICSRTDFRSLYEYLVANGLEFQSIAYVPNVTNADRPALEKEAREFYQTHYPSVNYTGFMRTASDPTDPLNYSFQPVEKRSYYFPQHLVEPVIGNEYFLDYDIYSDKHGYMLDKAVTEWTPILSNPLPSPKGNYVFLLHPGVNVSTSGSTVSPGLSSVTVLFSSIIKYATARQSNEVSIFIYDVTHAGINTLFGGARLRPPASNDSRQEAMEYEFLYEMDFNTLRRGTQGYTVTENRITIEHQTWAVIVEAKNVSFSENLGFVVMGGALILIACCCLALWFHSRVRRMMHIEEIKSAAEAEKSALIVKNAERAAQRERELNEYLAHEVRNPISAAMSASSFLSFAHQDPSPMIPGDDRHKTVLEDISIIQNSLNYINDLLRSLLDMQKVKDKQVKLVNTPTDMMKDIFEPVRTILSRQETAYKLILDCPDHLVIVIDRMRLKQILLNLAANAKKFVEKGFIRLSAAVVDNRLRLCVDDSGPGIPEGKRQKLFCRFQDSLDTLNQGTGMGLFLCKSLVLLMGGRIYLDEGYDSGIEGCPGTRFVVDLDVSPMDPDLIDLQKYDHVVTPDMSIEPPPDMTSKTSSSNSLLEQDTDAHDLETARICPKMLPETLNVLVVDDDMVLRKLLSRSLKRVVPSWVIEEAANGETAIELAAAKPFDLIFMDQYMASVEKQLLGTETTAALRAQGVKSRICGLSANNLEEAFLKAGANCFLLKPFRCEKTALEEDLRRILYG